MYKRQKGMSYLQNITHNKEYTMDKQETLNIIWNVQRTDRIITLTEDRTLQMIWNVPGTDRNITLTEHDT